MKPYISIIMLPLLFCLLLNLQAQDKIEQNKTEELKVGVTVPDLSFNNLLNYKTATLKLSDLKGKVVILDFWNTGCGPCIAAFPHIDSLQRQYKDKLMIIPVAREKTEVIRSFIDRFATVRKLKLTMPFENQNREIEKYFPHLTVPHQVWIGADGTYLGATQAIENSVLDSLVTGVLAGKIKSVGTVNNLILPFNPINPFEILSFREPLFYTEDGMAFNIKYREAMTAYIDGIGGFTVLTTGVPRLASINLPIQALYATAFGILSPERRNISNARTILEVKNKVAFIPPSMDQKYLEKWKNENLYSYDLMLKDVPPKYPKDYSVGQKLRNDTLLSKILLQTLDKRFSYRARIENREMECVIFKTIDTTLLKTTGEKEKITIYPGYSGASFKNVTLSKLIYSLGHSLQKHIVINETKFNGKVDVDLDAPLSRVKELDLAFKKYGLGLSFEKRVVPVLIISDK